ncbi:MAG TPA: DUF4190 domain-containing protein [Galbitalea sp.]
MSTESATTVKSAWGRATARVRVPVSLAQIPTTVASAVASTAGRFTVLHLDQSSALLTTGVSFNSWGGQLQLSFGAESDSASFIDVKYAPAMPTQIIDFGVGRRQTTFLVNAILQASSGPGIPPYQLPPYSIDRPVADRGVSKLAIWALVLACVSLIIFAWLGLVAIGLGARALWQTRVGYQGRGIAIAAIVIGAVSLVLWVVLQVFRISTLL